MDTAWVKWEVKRRYSEFERLERTLKECLTKEAVAMLPAMPSKGLRNNLAPEYCATRQEDLQQYLNALLLIDEVLDTEHLFVFLTGSMRTLVSNLQSTLGDLASKKKSSDDEIAKLQQERFDLLKSVQQAESQRAAAVAQLQSARRLIPGVNANNSETVVAESANTLSEEANASSKHQIDLVKLSSPKSVNNNSSQTLQSQLEIAKLCLEQLEQDKLALQAELEKSQMEKKFLVKEFKALRLELGQRST